MALDKPKFLSYSFNQLMSHGANLCGVAFIFGICGFIVRYFLSSFIGEAIVIWALFLGAVGVLFWLYGAIKWYRT